MCAEGSVFAFMLSTLVRSGAFSYTGLQRSPVEGVRRKVFVP